MSPDTRPQARPEIEMHVLPDGSSLLFDPVESAGHVLSPIAALAWDYCDGALRCDEIAGEIAALDPHLAETRAGILKLLDEFAGRGLLLVPDTISRTVESDHAR